MFTNLLILLLAGHFLMDFALQSDSMAQGKNRHCLSPGYNPDIHGKKLTTWPYWLSAHSACHAISVGYVLSPTLGICEFIAHWIIDFMKCERWYSIHVDQALHFSTKVILVLIWLLVEEGCVS